MAKLRITTEDTCAAPPRIALTRALDAINGRSGSARVDLYGAHETAPEAAFFLAQMPDDAWRARGVRRRPDDEVDDHESVHATRVDAVAALHACVGAWWPEGGVDG